ncbi:MAG: glycine--tRNA ligase subunit beta [Candidatus Melainabacteria bacterium]
MAPASNAYLLEVGTEELPIGFLKTAPEELTAAVRRMLEEQQIACGDVTVLATPRRLALIVEGLPDKQADREMLLKGPPRRIGWDDKDKPTPAAEGFAKKSGIQAADLQPQTIDGEEYLVFNRQVPGQAVKDVLAEQLPGLVLGLSGSHFMRWADTTIRFSRPIQWLLSLWNDQHLPLRIGPVSSGAVTRGHRILSQGDITVSSVAAYADTLEREGSVLVDQQQRRRNIWQAVEAAAGAMKGRVEPDEDLLDTVTMLVEWPTVVVGEFDPRFLEIPAMVSRTVMVAHQKYFPLWRAEDQQLLPHFITVSNGLPQASDNIRKGNTKVITARLEDARFFFREDQKTPLADRLEGLKGLTFQKGLGTLYDKTLRLEQLTGAMATRLPQQIPALACDADEARRAAHLVKADLSTGMVFEFPELQGLMGRQYARLGGETGAVAEAIYEHYLPRFMGDAVAVTPIGIIVSLADKMDTLVAVFSQEKAKLPTGSRDPLGLRRMATGILQTLMQNQLALDLGAWMDEAYTLLETQLKALPKPPAMKSRGETLALLDEFILQRLKVHLLELENRHDMIDAVLAPTPDGQTALGNLPSALARLEALKNLAASPEAFAAIYEPANRVARILGENARTGLTLNSVDAALFADDSERALLAALKPILVGSQPLSPGDQLQQLTSLTAPVNQFFEKVLVNDPDARVRENRYNLLSLIHGLYGRLAMFSKLTV